MNFEFKGKIFYWRGPAPFYFIEVPEKESSLIKSVAGIITYGWGVIPATITIGETTIKTSLFPKNGMYLVPLKKDLREKEGLELDEVVEVQLELTI